MGYLQHGPSLHTAPISYMTTELLTDRQDATLVMTLSGPAQRNALSPQVYAAGIEALNMAESSSDVRAVVITGAQGHFCAGGDLQRLAHLRQHDLHAQAGNMDAFHNWIEALRAFPKPVLAAVEGVAAGGGVSLALACDLIVAAEDARFVLAYGQMGLSPDGGATWHLTRALGRSGALAMLWAGVDRQSQSAQSWRQAGLVQRLAPQGTALQVALAWAAELGQIPAAALASMKELVNDADQAMRQQLLSEKQHFLVNLSKPEAGAAMERFLQPKA